MSYEEILSRFTYEDETEILKRVSKVNADDYRENNDIINEIVLWKMNRRPHIENKVIDMIHSVSDFTSPLEAVKSIRTEDVLVELLNSKGLKLPMASTVLHFFYPEIYPIIDQRAYRELYNEDYPKTVVSVGNLVGIYKKYIEDCYLYQQEKCPELSFSKIDKVLYQLDKDRGNKVKY